MSARSLKIPPWVAILTIPLLAATPPWCESRAAPEFAQRAQPPTYSGPAGAPRDSGISPSYRTNRSPNSPVVRPNIDGSRTTITVTGTNGNDASTAVHESGPSDIPADDPSHAPPTPEETSQG